VSEVSRVLVEQYTAALDDYLEGGGEAALQCAYELGRKALANGLGVLDMTGIYREALTTVLGREAASQESSQWIGAAVDFFSESLSPFEMAQRGFQETNALRRLNEELAQHAAQLTRMGSPTEDTAQERDPTEVALRKAYEELGLRLEKRTTELTRASEVLRAESAERQRAENSLQESQRHFREMAESLPQLVWTCRGDGWCDYLGPQWVRYTGIPEAEQRGFAWLDQLHPDDREPTIAAWNRAVEADTNFDVEFRIRRTDGVYRWFKTRAVPFRDADGKIVKWFGSNTDIHDLRIAEEILRESEERFRATFEQAAVGIAHVSIEGGQWLRINQKFCDIVGYTREALLERTFADITHPDDLIADYPYLRQMLAGEISTYTMEKRYFHKEGHIVWIHLTVSLVHDADGQPEYFIAVIEDITERKRIQEALRESEERTRLIIETALDAVITINAEGWITGWNAQAESFFGWSREEAVGRPLAPLIIPPQFREAHERGLRHFLATGEGPVLNRRIELTALYRGEREFPVELSISPIQSDEGFAFSAFVRDISERKQAEADREYMMSSGRCLLWYSDVWENGGEQGIHWELKPLNEAAAQRLLPLELPPDKTHITVWAESHLPEDRARMDAYAIQKVREGKSYRQEFRCRNKYGEIQWLQEDVHVETVASGRWKIVGVTTDITERKKAEEEIHQLNVELEQRVIERTTQLEATNQELKREVAERQRAEEAIRASERQMQDFLDNCTAIIFLKDMQGRYLMVNRQFEVFYRKTKAQAIGKTDYDLFSREMAEKFRANDLTVLEAPGPVVEEVVANLEDGKHTYILVMFALRDADGQSYALGGFATDISDRTRAEEEIQILNQRLQQHTVQLEATNKELEAFSYSVSHDLRAPLRSIDGFSLALLEDYAETLDADGKDYLQRVRAATQRMAQLIDDLLNLSRVTRAEMSREVVDMSTLARHVAAELQKTEPERQAEFAIEDSVMANGDTRLLRVVLENLLGNAWKFTAKRDRPRIEFGCTQQEEGPVYFVRDNGAGFDMAYADRLFGAFQRLHAMTEFGGTGIGLATVQRIVHRHGGHVWAEGAVEKGATFYFTL
jgi:PAS domain S-box-containing protein